MSIKIIFQAIFTFCIILMLSSTWAPSAHARSPKKSQTPPKTKTDTGNPSVIQLLTSVQNKLSNEAARLQIQARGLSKAEIERLNALYQSIGNLKEMISMLESTALKDDHFAQPKAFAREPKPKAKPKSKPKAKQKK